MINKEIYSSIDRTIEPGRDFAKYATGRWILSNPKPADYPDWGPFSKVVDCNIHRMANLIQKCASGESDNSPMSRKIGDLYNIAMDVEKLNLQGPASLKKYLDEIQAISSREEFIFGYCAKKHRNPFWGFCLAPDDMDSSMNILHISQGGLSMAREYYQSEENPDIQRVFLAFRTMAVKLMSYHGFENAEAIVDDVLELERGIAQRHHTRAECRIPEMNYHKMDLDTLSKTTDGFPWKRYLDEYGYDQTTEVNLAQIQAVRYGCSLLMNEPLERIKNFMIMHKVVACATSLDEKCYSIWFEYNHIVTGQEDPGPRWKYAEEVVDSILAPVVGMQYVEEYFSQEAKDEAYAMIKNIQAAFAQRIRKAEWMSEKTKAIALDKLESMTIKVGYPDKYDDLSGLEIDPSKTFVDNLDAIGRFFWNLRKEKYYNKPVDKSEWSMNPQDVNAYYDPSSNEICFPAAILQEPFFSPNGDLAQNYGMIGCVIAHEMTHGFDDEGRKYDKNGNLSTWWSPEDIEAFKIPTERYVEYYNKLWVLPPSENDPDGLHPKGDQCLGENIADLGGINIAYDAFKKCCERNPQEDFVLDGIHYTPEMRFFLAYAHVWTTNGTDDLYRYLTNIDVHSVGYLRVNGPLPQIQAWYDAFGITPNDPLYIAPEARIRIW